MESAELGNTHQVYETSGLHFGDQLVQTNILQTEDVSEYLLTDLESIMEEVQDSLTISRTVSSAVIKGMVSAISQEAADLVAAKEREVVGLRENMEELRLEQQYRGEIEALVIRNILQGVKEVDERKLLEQGVHLCNAKSATWKVKQHEETSGLHRHLNEIWKCLANLEAYGSSETDHLHLKFLNSHVSPTGRQPDEFNISLPENFDSSQLTHLNKLELYHYFRTHITKMKRDHESAIQAMTENFFSLKREILKEKGSSLPFKKEKDFEMLRKKISDVAVELDEIVSENKRLSETCDNSTDSLERLMSENLFLDSILATKCDKVNQLSSELSDTRKKLSENTVVETQLNEVIGHLKSGAEDMQIEASAAKEVYICYLRGMLLQAKYDVEENDAQSAMSQEFIKIVYEEALQNAAAAPKWDFTDPLDFESIAIHVFSGIVFEELLKGAAVELKTLNTKCIQNDELIDDLKCNALELEMSLVKEAEVNSRLKNEIAVLEKERDVLKSTQMELMDNRVHHEAIIDERTKELNRVNDKLEKCLERTTRYEEEIASLTQRLELAEEDNRRAVLDAHNSLQMAKVKDAQQRKQTESTVHELKGLLEAFSRFELRVMEEMKWKSLRLENATSQLSSLCMEANVFRRKGLLCKEMLERKTSDLRKAEAEVDLLGDEVENLLGLLERIYVALDHYSPVLKHYPGVMEILKLVRKELTGEAIKSI